jgi:hypothetical protein
MRNLILQLAILIGLIVSMGFNLAAFHAQREINASVHRRLLSLESCPCEADQYAQR